MFVLLFLICCIDVNSIELKYKYSIGNNLTYSQIEIVERHETNRRIDETIEFIQMNFTDFIQENNLIKRKINSIKMIPKNELKLKELSKQTFRQIDDEFLSKPISLSTYNGNVLLLPTNEIRFPFDDIQINQTWIHQIENSLGEIHYKLKSIEQNRFAKIEYEGTLSMISFADLIGNITFDIENGRIISEYIISSSSLLFDFTFTKTIIKQFLF